ncbi:MAG TPA: helix-hairpin-helix domain-containing protein, partial [Flavisolibacter sp.]
NGTAGRETEALVRSIEFGKPVSIFQVNESGASIYSASEVAREEFPDQDVTVRGAISIGRRLLDPLSELVKIDPKSIGVGQYQHDVNQTKLKAALDRVVESAVNFVGVDVNTASKHLLQYVSGISSTLANNIVQYRTANGPFKSRNELKKVSLMGPKAFEQCAGFLRIPNAENLLDNSSVHPERYGLIEQMAKDVQASLEELIKNAEIRKKINKHQYINETVGEYTIEDILKELEKPGRDPRAQIEEFQFDATIKSIEDVKVGMAVPGIVTNITAFGAFVDIGVKQDGLVHVSQLSNRFVSDPKEVVKLNQKVTVTVTEVDVARKRIALTMKTEQGTKPAAPKPSSNIKPEVRSTNIQKKPVIKNQDPLNSFQKSLMDLRKKFQ